MSKGQPKRSPSPPATQGSPPAGTSDVPKRFAAKIHTEKLALSRNELGTGFARADLVLRDVDHGAHSYEARVFFNNPEATAATPVTIDEGYAGSLHIFGHGGCFGDVGHCEVNDRGKALTDKRGLHPLTPIRKELIVTDALRAVLEKGKLETVTLVPIATGRPTGSDPAQEDVLRYGSLKLLTYA